MPRARRLLVSDKVGSKRTFDTQYPGPCGFPRCQTVDSLKSNGWNLRTCGYQSQEGTEVSVDMSCHSDLVGEI